MKRSVSRVTCGLLLVLMGFAVRLRSDTGKDYLSQGISFERQKNYQEAIDSYLESLRIDPLKTVAYRGLGNCYYFLSNKAAALAAYDKYLDSYPDDFQVKAFRDRLSGGQEEALPLSRRELRREAKARKAKEKEARRENQDRTTVGKLQMKLTAGWAGYAMSRWNDAVGGKNAGSVGADAVEDEGASPMSSGTELGLNLDYGISDELEIGADIEYWILGGSLYQNYVGGGTVQDASISYSMNTLWVGPNIRWRINPVEDRVGVYLEGGIGYMVLLGAGIKDSYDYVGGGTILSSSSNGTENGSGFGARGAVGLQFGNPGGFIFDLALQARTGGISSVKQTPNDSNALKNGTITDANGAAIPLDYSGLGLRLGLGRTF